MTGGQLATVPVRTLNTIITAMDTLTAEQASAVVQALAERYLEWGAGTLVTVRSLDEMYHHVTTLCGQGWSGMVATDDLAIQVRRALDHAAGCAACARRWKVLTTPGTFVSTVEVDQTG